MRTITQNPARGIASLSAKESGVNNSDLNAAITQLNELFAKFKEANDDRINNLEKGFGDSLDALKVDKINSKITEIEKELGQLNALKAASLMNGGSDLITDPEYVKAFAAHMRKGDIQASLNKGEQTEGGYLAPVEWDRTIGKRLTELSPMRSLCRVQKIGTAGFKKLFQVGGVSSGWVGETDERPETDTAIFKELAYATAELYANPHATMQMLDDSEVDLEEWLADEIEEEFALQEGAAFIGGSGTNKPYGLLTFAEGESNATKHPLGAIKTKSSGAVDKITPDALLDLIYGLKKSYRNNAGFFMNNMTLAECRKLKDGDGNYLWQPSTQAGQPSLLNGYAVHEIEDMPDIAANALPIGFGDLRRTYLIVDRAGVRVLRDPYSKKPFVGFYTTKRVGGSLLNPEACKLMKVGA